MKQALFKCKALCLITTRVLAISCLSFLTYYAPLSAQVTIGSNQEPSAGALLDLKEENATTKGLVMPRVELKERNKLIMGDMTIEDVDDVYLQHTGLMVYNISKTDYCAQRPLYEGIYVWNGTQWIMASQKPLSNDVLKGIDQNGNRFLYRKFGDAGYWMLENLRATKFDPVRDGVDPTNATLSGPSFNPNHDSDVALWSYPQIESSVDPTNSSLYDANPSLGLLYTWAGVSRGLPDIMGDDSGENENPVKLQGICPSGWHIPSDKEWTLLENEMQTNTSKYSTTPDIGGTIALPGQNTEANLAAPITSPCEPHDTWVQGTSLSKEMGGFASLYAGQINGENPNYYGKATSYWTCSRNHYLRYIRIISPSEYGTEWIMRSTSGQSSHIPVRCKKN